MGLTVTDMPASRAHDPTQQTLRGCADGADCPACPFGRGGKPNQPVFGEGPVDPAWIVVGEGPGHNEVIQGRPFVGLSGQLVNEALTKIQAERKKLLVTNATLCIPHSGATDTEKKLARTACRPRLQQELAKFPGKPVLALGAIAAQSMTGNEKFSITQMAGAYYEVDFDGTGPRQVIPSIHPAAILRGGTGGGGGGGHTVDLAFWNLLYDAQKVNMLAQGRGIKFSDDIAIELTDADRALALITAFAADARRLGSFACDTETYVDNPKQHTALSPTNAKLSVLGLATTENAISVAWDICYPNVLAPLDELFADETIRKVFHNRIYDVPVLERHGFVIKGPIHCTMLAHHSAFPGLAHGLQRVGTQFYCIPPWKAEHRHGQGSLEELAKYNARDTLVTARIEKPITLIIKKSLAEKTYDVDLKMAHAATVMHVQGVPIDRDTNEKLRVGFKTNIDKARAELDAKVFDPAINDRYRERLAFEQSRRTRKNDPVDFDLRMAARLDEMTKKSPKFLVDSGDHVVAFLKACGVPLSLQTTSGRISTKKDILESFVSYPEVRALLNYRENAKLLSTYIERMFDRYGPDGTTIQKYGFADPWDRVHPRWSVHKITGRWGSEAPVCFDGETEILTPGGWVRFDALPEGTPVAQFSKETDEISFVKPTLQFSKPYVGDMIRITGRYTDLCVTPDHRLLVERRSGLREDVLAGDYAPNAERYSIHAGKFAFGTAELTPDALTFLCAAQADGWWQTSGWCFGLSKPRKIERLCAALTNLGLTYTTTETTTDHAFKPGEQKTTTRIYVHRCAIGDRIHERLGVDKLYGAWLLDFSKATIEQFIDEVVFWDGNFTRGGEFFSSDRASADWVQTVLTLANRRTLMYAYDGSPHQTRTNWQVRFRPRTRCATSATVADRIPWNGLVYCVSVPESYVVTRRNGRVIVVGQCQNVPKADKKKGRPNLRSQVMAPHGRNFVAFDAKQLEARLIALMSGDPFLLSIFHNDKDIHTEFARIVWPEWDTIPVDERKVRRDLIKRPEYGAFYGGSVETLWKSVVRDYPNVTIGMIQKMVQLMQLKMPGVAAWHANMMRIADRDGEIRSMILGRRRCFPIKQFDLSEVVNFPIQSSGADLINLGLADIMPRLPITTFPILQIHDAVVFECDEDDTDLVKQLVVESFTREVDYNGNRMNFPVDAKAGKSWDIVN